MDFIIVVNPIYYDEIIAQRRGLGGTPGHLLHVFSREHVRETVAYMVGVKVSREILSLSKTRDGHLNLVTAIHAGG